MLSRLRELDQWTDITRHIITRHIMETREIQFSSV